MTDHCLKHVSVVLTHMRTVIYEIIRDRLYTNKFFVDCSTARHILNTIIRLYRKQIILHRTNQNVINYHETIAFKFSAAASEEREH